MENTSITNFFLDTTIFITGGTGFLGLALLEKLLRSCKGIKTIYVLLRSKKGQNVNQRYEELINDQVTFLIVYLVSVLFLLILGI